MRKYGGHLVHSGRDEWGPVEVVDTFGIRSLHFGTCPKQSAQALADPERLELSYVRAMLAGLLFVAEPSRILILGLGGGSLARFLLKHIPDCRIDAVESRPLVANVARRYFGLPEDARLAVHISDAYEFVCQPARCDGGEYRYILVDVYDHEGLAPSINQHDFFAAAASLLAADGVFAMNLWGTQAASFRSSIRLMNLYFEGGMFRLQVPGRGNVIGFGLGTDVVRGNRAMLEQRAKSLERLTGIEFSRLLKQIAPALDR